MPTVKKKKGPINNVILHLGELEKEEKGPKLITNITSWGTRERRATKPKEKRGNKHKDQSREENRKAIREATQPNLAFFKRSTKLQTFT